MDVNVMVGDFKSAAVDALVIGVFEGEEYTRSGIVRVADEALNGAIRRLVELGDFEGKHKQTAVLYTNDAVAAPRLAVVGLGKSDQFDAEKAREAAGEIACSLRDLGVKTIGIPTPSDAPPEMIQAATEGSLLALYQFNQHKTEGLYDVKELDAITYIVSDQGGSPALEEAVVLGDTLARGTMLARDLSNQPGNKLTPTMLAEKAQQVAEVSGLDCEIFDLAELKEKGFGTLLAVAQGSEEEPRFIALEYVPEGGDIDTVVLVGKGITFDTGGISLKPGKGMEEMKHDMSGAAAVLGAMQVIGDIKPDLHVVGLIAATENMPSGTAIKPGDVVTSYSGKTVEIINTDAEGRLVLADALGYAARYEPRAVIDLATLTGAVIVALGNLTAGMMGTDQELMDRLRAAGEKTHERVWQLPLWDDYDEQIKSDTADAKNVGDGTAGTIAGAVFLKKFAEGYPWVHLDIAGTAWDMKGSSYVPKTASGYGVRLLVQVVQDW
ncbi:MAG: leucyl aminopeptidase [Candidatus Poribacteria bacterium]|nr:leucyl aminopeptidase [Candidatus Poribacteria bacterium]